MDTLPTEESTELMIAQLDDAGRSRVQAVFEARTNSVRAVRKASIEKGTHREGNDRVTQLMIKSAIRKEALNQTERLAKRNKRIEERRTLRLRVRFEQSEEYKQQLKAEMRAEMEAFGVFSL